MLSDGISVFLDTIKQHVRFIKNLYWPLVKNTNGTPFKKKFWRHTFIIL